MNVKIYVEGGGDGRDLLTRCRSGFRTFFAKASLAGRMPRIIACGSRNTAYDKFCTAFRNRRTNEFIVLLVDSENPVAAGNRPWRHLEGRDGWARPSDATEDQAHLMVQCMEAWFLADADALVAYFGPDFKPRALPGTREIETVEKVDVLRGLRNATRQCNKGTYGKGRHSFDILEQLDPAKVFAVSPHANRLIETLRETAI